MGATHVFDKAQIAWCLGRMDQIGINPYCDSVALASLALPRWTSLRTTALFSGLRDVIVFVTGHTGSNVECVQFLAYWTTSNSLTAFAAEMVSQMSGQRMTRVW